MIKKNPALKMTKVSDEFKELLSKRLLNGAGDSLDHVMHLTYKGEKYTSVIRTTKTVNTDSLKQVSPLLKLSDFLGTLPKDGLNFFSSKLTKSQVRRNLNAIFENYNDTDSQRILLKGETSLDIHVLSRNVERKRVLGYIREDFKYTDAGRKSKQRESSRVIDTENHRIFGDVYAKKSAGVYIESGRFLVAHVRKLNQILETSKNPMTKERHLGIELEFLMPKDKRIEIENTLRNSPYKNYFSLGRDGSVNSSDEYLGAELRICVPASQYHEVILFVSQTLIGNGCKVDKSCGLHVHLDSRFDDPKKIFENLLDQQAAIFDLVPKSRRDNQYCRYTKKGDYLRGERYKSINSCAYNKYKTIEVRLHGGTIEAEKINNWILLLTTIGYSTADVTRSSKVKTMITKFDFSESLKAFFLAREEKFASHGSVSGSGEEAA